jgi:hypothetical protein
MFPPQLDDVTHITMPLEELDAMNQDALESSENTYGSFLGTDMTKPLRPVKFVSHRTHRTEDLGVDHIFVKPAAGPHADIYGKDMLKRSQSQQVQQSKNTGTSGSISGGDVTVRHSVAVGITGGRDEDCWEQRIIY